jgi:hypothetical protein
MQGDSGSHFGQAASRMVCTDGESVQHVPTHFSDPSLFFGKRPQAVRSASDEH